MLFNFSWYILVLTVRSALIFEYPVYSLLQYLLSYLVIHNLGQNKMEQQTLIPPKSRMKPPTPSSYLWFGGEGKSSFSIYFVHGCRLHHRCNKPLNQRFGPIFFLFVLSLFIVLYFVFFWSWSLWNQMRNVPGIVNINLLWKSRCFITDCTVK